MKEVRKLSGKDFPPEAIKAEQTALGDYKGWSQALNAYQVYRDEGEAGLLNFVREQESSAGQPRAATGTPETPTQPETPPTAEPTAGDPPESPTSYKDMTIEYEGKNWYSDGTTWEKL